MKKLRIFLADDHAVVREGLKLLVSAQMDMEVVGEAGDGNAAVQQAADLTPDVVVMDISMPELNGLQTTEALKKVCPQVKVLTLTRHTDTAHLQQLLLAGASGYVLKQSVADELIRAIRAVAIGGTYLDPAIAQKIIANHNGRLPTRSTPNLRVLGERETEVLRLIARGYSNKEIAARLELSVKTVEAHKSNAMKKLDLHSRIEIVRFAILCGWLQDP